MNTGYCFKAQFKDEMKAEKWMVENVLENGFYRKMSDGWYVVFEWVEGDN